MKRTGRYALLTLVMALVVLFFSGTGHALPLTYTIMDTPDNVAYWGGKVINAGAGAYGDIIGRPEFSVDSMIATRNDADLTFTVTLTGNYFNDPHYNSWGPGDLYISTSGWYVEKPENNARLDTFTATEGWNYVVTGGYKNADGSWSVAPGVYELDFSKITWTNTTNPNHPGTWVYRAEQAWRGGYGQLVNENASYTRILDPQSGKYVGRYTFGESNVSWVPGVDPGAHWTMQCGNDVIEGRIPDPPTVPEPGALLLLGIGLAGLAGLKRKSDK